MAWLRCVSLMVAMLMAVPVVALAQDDDAQDDDAADDDADDDATTDDDAADDDSTGGGFSGTLDFASPDALAPNTEFNFEFRVENTTSAEVEGDHWIYLVEIYMPSPEYAINGNLMAPDAIHGGEWTAELLEDVTDSPGIRWMHSNVVTSAAYGDIREGEYLDFAFNATTDAEGSDGFDFRLVTQNDDFVTGTAYIGEEPGDDDDTTDAGDDDDDDDDDGCGC